MPTGDYFFFFGAALTTLATLATLTLAALAGAAFLVFRLAARTARALARLAARPLSWAICLRASENFLAVRGCLLGMPNCFRYSPGFRPCSLDRWRAKVF